MNLSTLVSQVASALGDPSHGWLISPSTGGASKRDEVESKVERGCLRDRPLLHDQPQTGRKRAEDTSSVGRHRVLFAYPCVPDPQESKTVEPIVPYQQSNQPGSRKRLLEEQFEC